MNNIAVIPYIGMHALQIQNIKRNVVKKASIQELNNEQRPSDASDLTTNETQIEPVVGTIHAVNSAVEPSLDGLHSLGGLEGLDVVNK